MKRKKRAWIYGRKVLQGRGNARERIIDKNEELKIGWDIKNMVSTKKRKNIDRKNILEHKYREEKK